MPTGETLSGTLKNGKEYFFSTEWPMTANCTVYKCEHEDCDEWHVLPFSREQYEAARRRVFGEARRTRAPRKKPTPHGAVE